MPIHPAVADRLGLLDGIDSFPAAFADPGQRARVQAFLHWPRRPAAPVVEVEDDTVAGPHGPVPVRVYRPRDDTSTGRPLLVWCHGGGFRSGDLDMPEADTTAREVCVRADAVVVSVDYRLAVDGVHHPVPLDDVVAVARHVRDHAADLRADVDRIVLGGASAGGTLAVGTALRLRDEDGWLPRALALAYTSLHAVVPAPDPELADLLRAVPRPLRFLPADSAEIIENYLGGPAENADGYAFPAAADLTGLCATLLVNAEYDDLRASAQDFAARLAGVGVDVTQVCLPGMLHAFLDLPATIAPVDRALTLLAGTLC